MSPSSPAFSSCSVVSAASSSSSLPSSSFSFSSAGYNKLVECCILLGGLAFFGSSYLIFTNWWMTGCHVCPGRGSMTHPQRVVPGGSGITCGDLERIQSNCWDHRPLGKKFDLGAYCGCDGSEPPLNECTFDCPLQSGLVPPSVWPSKTSRGKSKPTHFDEIILLDTTLAPTERPSANDESEPSDSVVSSSNGLFDADIMMCNDVSTVVPFIKDQGFCMEVQEFCCPAITTMAQTAPMEIPSACMMCENGRQVLEEKLLPGDENGKKTSKKRKGYFVFLLFILLHFLTVSFLSNRVKNIHAAKSLVSMNTCPTSCFARRAYLCFANIAVPKATRPRLVTWKLTLYRRRQRTPLVCIGQFSSIVPQLL